MKEEMNLNVLLDGCPRELHDFAGYLKTLGYPDEPSYGLLENNLRNIVIRQKFEIILCPLFLLKFKYNQQVINFFDNYILCFRHGISADEPYDWEINYENLGPKVRLNGSLLSFADIIQFRKFAFIIFFLLELFEKKYSNYF